MTRYFSNIDTELNGEFYEDRMPSGAVPQITQEVPEFFAGVQVPKPSQIVLSNLDNAITDQKAAGGYKRSKRVIVSKAYGSINQGLVTLDPAETYTEYRGVIDNTSTGEAAVISMLPADIDVFDEPIPFQKVTTDLWPDALDIDADIPVMATGTAKQIPLALVLAQETPSEKYQYLVARGDRTIDNVYRDKLALSTYPGTATATTSSTVTLAGADQRDDDFYNKKYIEMDGEVRLITDYDKGTNRATVSPSGSWTAGAYTIREWKKITQSINSITYTLIEFARRQRDTSERLYQRNRMSADITGATTERNPARYIETLLGLFPEVSLNAAGFTTAADAVTAEGDLFVDGALIKPRRVFDVLDQVCKIGRLRLVLNDAGEMYPIMDGQENVIHGQFIYDDNIIEIGPPDQLPLGELWKTIAIEYRLLYDENDYRLTTAQHDVNIDEGRINKVFPFDQVFDKTTADKLACYLAKRKNSFDDSIPVTLNHEARGRELGQLVFISLDIPSIAGTYQITRRTLSSNGYSMELIPYDAKTFLYTPKALPSDPVTDNQADFRFTPAAAVTGLGVNWTVTELNVSASAELSWINPSVNYAGAKVEFKKSSVSLWELSTTATASVTNATIPGLEPGILYDFRITSINIFGDDEGGVATILGSLAPGSTAPTAPPQPSAERHGRTYTWITAVSDDSRRSHLEWEIRNQSDSLIATIGDAGASIARTEDGTSSLQRKARCRSVGYPRAGGPPLTSSWSSYSTLLSTATYVTGDFSGLSVTNPILGPLSAGNAKIAGSAIDENKRITVYVADGNIPSTSIPANSVKRNFFTKIHNKGRTMVVTIHASFNTQGLSQVQHSTTVIQNTSTQIQWMIEIYNHTGSTISGVGYGSTIDYW